MRGLLLAVFLLTAASTPAAAQWVYFSAYPNSCIVDYVFDRDDTGVFIRAWSGTITIGTSFRLELSGLGPEDIVSVSPGDGVSILGGNVIDGITLSWAPRVITNAPVLRIGVANNPPVNEPESPWIGPYIATRDVTLFTPDGFKDLADVETGINILVHCWNPFAWFEGPDTVDVTIGKRTQFRVDVDFSGEYLTGASVYGEDDAGWLVDTQLGAVVAACPVCPWDVTTIPVDVDTPDDVAPGTLSACHLWAEWNGVFGSHDVVLRAVKPIATETTSFGRLKALYRRNTD